MTQSATLVSVALRAAADPGVEFEVTHVDGVAEPDAPSGTAAPADTGWLLGEVFTSYGTGNRLEVRARRVGPVQHLPDLVSQAISSGATAIGEPRTIRGPAGRRTTWAGGAPGDPDFFFNFEDKLDLLLTFREDSGLAATVDSRVLAEALLVVSRSAGVDVELPVTFVRSPSAGFDTSQLHSPDDVDGDPLLARGVSLRITVGLDQSDPRARFALLALIADFAASRGYELRVADRRFGSISGQWILVNAMDAKTLAATQRPVGHAGAPRPRSALLTVVGPSRQGSFSSVATALDAAGLRPRAVTCLSLHDVAFSHFEIDLNGDPATAARWAELPPTVSLLGLVAAMSAPDEVAADRSDLHAARDHQCLLSGAFDAPQPDSGLWHPVWASWEVRDVPAAVGATGAVQRLRDLFLEGQADLIADCLPEYYRFRRRSSENVIERVKLRVRLRRTLGDTESVQATLADVCRDVQRAMRQPGGWSMPTAALGDDDPAPRLVKLRVARRERWLGTWLDDPR